MWLFRGTKLFKASPQQLRHASEREEAWAELQEDHPIPWTISGILEQSKTKTYIDLAKEGIPEPEQEEDDSQGGGTRSECNTTSPLSTKRTRN